eukprot:Pompholyxophrys_punicea_v1_NODE_51_length_4304_cov_7.342359.p2 type:complete len:266 gc:universal NODE_51_length_4304_cov_7.342359:3938-3141(-)
MMTVNSAPNSPDQTRSTLAGTDLEELLAEIQNLKNENKCLQRRILELEGSTQNQNKRIYNTVTDDNNSTSRVSRNKPNNSKRANIVTQQTNLNSDIQFKRDKGRKEDTILKSSINRKNDLVIVGLPDVSSVENMTKDMKKIFLKLNPDSETNVNRYLKRGPVLITEFHTATAKRDFLLAVKKFRKTHQPTAKNLLDVTIDGLENKLIYFNNNLTKDQYDILKKIRQLKKDSKIALFWTTYDGSIYIKKTIEDEPLMVKDLDAAGL